MANGAIVFRVHLSAFDATLTPFSAAPAVAASALVQRNDIHTEHQQTAGTKSSTTKRKRPSHYFSQGNRLSKLGGFNTNGKNWIKRRKIDTKFTLFDWRFFIEPTPWSINVYTPFVRCAQGLIPRAIRQPNKDPCPCSPAIGLDS